MKQTTGQPATITTRPRNSLMAFLFSLLFPGLGQFYNGQPKKAAIFISLLLLCPLLFGITRGATFFYGLISLTLIVIALRIYIIIDGVRNAKRQKEYALKPYNTWYYYLLMAIGISAILNVYNFNSILGIQTFKIPSTSNSPTFQVDDLLMADMRAYKDKEPDYGDIVVYSHPDRQMYTFRVVGRPNDHLELIDNIVTINGKPGKATFTKETTSDYMSVMEFEEELPNGHKHLIYKSKQPYDSTKTNISHIYVPADCYYVLGDNRDNAIDSRYEGFISKDQIIGRIIYSCWGQTTKRINIDFRDR